MLKGSALAHFITERRSNGVTLAREIAPAAGYVKPNGRIAYTQFYSECLKLSTRRDAINNPARDCINNVIRAIQTNSNYHYRNDRVWIAESGNTYVYYKCQLICIIQAGEVRLLRGNKTKAIKERLNRILMHLCGVKLFQKGGEWFIFEPGVGDELYTNRLVPILE